MPGIIERYTKWLHTQWPAGTVEKLPDSGEDGATALPGVRIVGDLTGIPPLKFSSDTGARAVRAILQEPDFHRSRNRNGETARRLISQLLAQACLEFPRQSKPGRPNVLPNL